MRRIVTLTVVVAITALFLIGCRLTVSHEVWVNPDGTVDLSVMVTADREMIEMMSQETALTGEKQEKEDFMRQVAKQTAGDINKTLKDFGVKASPVVLEDAAGTRVEVKGLPASRVQTLLDALWKEGLGVSTSGATSFTVRTDSNLWNTWGRVELTFPPVVSEVAAVLTQEVKVHVPGRVVSTNGTASGESAVQWTWTFPTEHTAWVSFKAPNWPGRLLVLGAAGAVIAAAGAAILRRRGRTLTCPGCGARIARGARFCTSCGAQVGPGNREGG